MNQLKPNLNCELYSLLLSFVISLSLLRGHTTIFTIDCFLFAFLRCCICTLHSTTDIHIFFNELLSLFARRFAFNFDKKTCNRI